MAGTDTSPSRRATLEIESDRAALSMSGERSPSAIFVTIAFYGKFALLPVIGGPLAAKALVWGLAIPLLYLAVAVGRRLDRG